MIEKIILFFLIGLVFTPCCVQSQIKHKIKNVHLKSVISLDDLLKKRDDIEYIHLSDAIEMFRDAYPLSENITWWMQDPLIYPKRFILRILNGKVFSKTGFIILDDMFIDELLWELTKQGIVETLPSFKKIPQPKLIHGKVAVITQAGTWNYYHWMTEVLPKLAMLEQADITYDYLYLPLDRSYMKETIELLGIDHEIIIDPNGLHKCIQADELIVPSLVCSFCYTPRFAIDFLRENFIPLAQKSVDHDRFAKRIFISRRKASSRKIKNEDEVFALFEQYGFVRYNLEELSILEQVMLFYHAEFIAGEHGAGLTNIIFAQRKAHLIEIFQAREDATYWYLSQEVGLQHTCIKTIEFDTRKGDSLNSGFVNSKIPLESIQDVLVNLFDE